MLTSCEGFVCGLKNKNQTATARPFTQAGVTWWWLRWRDLARSSSNSQSGDSRPPPNNNAEDRIAVFGVDWWRWAESNRRPEALHSRDYMLSLAIWISFSHRRRTGCGRTSRLALALRPSGPTARDRSKGPRCGLRCYPLVTRAERRPVRGPAGLSRQSVRFVVRS